MRWLQCHGRNAAIQLLYINTPPLTDLQDLDGMVEEMFIFLEQHLAH